MMMASAGEQGRSQQQPTADQAIVCGRTVLGCTTEGCPVRGTVAVQNQPTQLGTLLAGRQVIHRMTGNCLAEQQ